jgi:preprotein translocase subunit SecE
MAEEVKVSRFSKTQKNTVRFFKEIRHELKKVIWPGKAQLINNTVSVLVVCVLIGAVIWAVDLGLGTVVDSFLTK